ncbi:MAG: biotin transporter BioY [Dehalococcoidales bacterium]|nr:biotin transporter BioY [Dehalococcoidales bacterium]
MRSSTSLALAPTGLRRISLAQDLALVLLGSVVVGLSAQVAVYLPFTPVPISGQTFAVLLVGMALGSRRGALALLAYIAEGAAGLPVFAAGLAGPAVVLGPRGGYLFGMILAAYLVGRLAERGWSRRAIGTAGAMVAGEIAIYALGIPWLAVVLGTDLPTALSLGLFPFLLGDAIKVALAAGGVPVALGLIGRQG